jgi:hypothetical protein
VRQRHCAASTLQIVTRNRNFPAIRARFEGIRGPQKAAAVNRRDQKLLNRQLGRVAAAPWRDRVLIVAIAAAFFSGIAVAGFMLAPNKAPTRTAMNNATATTALFLSGGPNAVQ